MKNLILRILTSFLLIAGNPLFAQSTVSGGSSLLDRLLRPLSGSMSPVLCQYREAVMLETKPFLDGRLVNGDSDWSCKVLTNPVPGDQDAVDLTLVFCLESGLAKSSGVAVTFDFSQWSPGNYVMIPASVYNGNRNRIVKRDYAAGLNREDLYRKDLRLTTTDLPQLSPEPGRPSKIEVSSCNTTTPAICFYDKAAKRAFILLAEQGIRVGDQILDNGMTVEENSDRSRATLIISAPGVRSRKPEFIGFSASGDRAPDWKTGDEITLRLRIFSFKSPDIPGLLEKFMTVRKAVTGPNQPRNLIPFSEISRLMAKNIDSRYYDKGDFRFYCPENADWISFGWVGGLMNTYPMLVAGDDWHFNRVASTFNFAIPRAQGQSGYFYGALNFDGKCFGREGYDEFPEISLTRKNGDVLFWMIKQFELLKAQGRTSLINRDWEENILRLARAFAETWEKYGQWGNFVNINTGEVAVYNTTGGASAVGGLALASDYFHNPGFLRIAMEAADLYYTRDFEALGMTTGACADILQNADSESAAALMTSLMVLYELTGDARWLEKSRNLANLCATWTVSYDYVLPPETELAQLGAKLAGVVWASTQNKHGAPGICTSSGDPLFRIFRATGDRRYAFLLFDIVHAWAEGVQPNGWITERLTYCDADSRGTRGTLGKTGWNELNGILMATEIPGIYLQTDSDVLYVFDHVTAKVVKRGLRGVEISVTNPTRFDASVSLFAEKSAAAKKAIGTAGFLKWRRLEIKAGETRIFLISG